MRLDELGMEKIRHLEHMYGQLSNTPDDHPFIEKLAAYGKDTRPKLDTLITFYISENEINKLNQITIDKGITRTPVVRKWIVDFLKKPYPINLSMDVPKEKTLSFNIYADDYKKLKSYADKSNISIVDFPAILVKTKINEID